MSCIASFRLSKDSKPRDVCVLKNIDKIKSKGGVVSYCQKFKTVCCVLSERKKQNVCVCYLREKIKTSK